MRKIYIKQGETLQIIPTNNVDEEVRVQLGINGMLVNQIKGDLK